MPEVEEEEPERRGPSLKSIFEQRAGFSGEGHCYHIGTDTVFSTGTHLRVTRIRAYLASAAGPPGAIYSSNRGLPEHRDLLGSS